MRNFRFPYLVTPWHHTTYVEFLFIYQVMCIGLYYFLHEVWTLLSTPRNFRLLLSRSSQTRMTYLKNDLKVLQRVGNFALVGL
jgi:hypothetical protein